MSTIYSKLAEARKMVGAHKITKSGKNNYQNYEYYELEDILPCRL